MLYRPHALASSRLVCCVFLWAACGGSDEDAFVTVPSGPDAGAPAAMAPDASATTPGCAPVELNGEVLVEHLQDFTARFEVGAAYERTVMLFGGEPVQQPNTPSRAYIFALDKVDAQRMAMIYPDFYLCSSPGGQEAASYIHLYDLIPATCEIHQQLVAAIRRYSANAVRGGDRTSLELEGAPLRVISVTADATGEDVSDQVSDQQLHLVTSVKQLTGESVLSFGTTEP